MVIDFKLSPFHIATMVKGNPKSSASSATRKKHAAKKTAVPDVDEPPNATQKRITTKAERKLLKKEPRVKMYIPPVKPAPAQLDPLETTGLARTLPADLLVVLRNISKKAQVTKIRALEELQTGWIEKCMKDEEIFSACVAMLPVWVRPSLNSSWSKRMLIHLKVASCLSTVSASIASCSVPCCVSARFLPPHFTRSDLVFPSRDSIPFSNRKYLGCLVFSIA